MTEASHDYYNLQNLDPAHVALYNVGRLRTDIWHFLRDSARRLRRIQQDPRHADDKMWLTTACGEVFDFLRPLGRLFRLSRASPPWSSSVSASTAGRSTIWRDRRCDWCG